MESSEVAFSRPAEITLIDRVAQRADKFGPPSPPTAPMCDARPEFSLFFCVFFSAIPSQSSFDDTI
jgi:hypothetical protein